MITQQQQQRGEKVNLQQRFNGKGGKNEGGRRLRGGKSKNKNKKLTTFRGGEEYHTQASDSKDLASRVKQGCRPPHTLLEYVCCTVQYSSTVFRAAIRKWLDR